MQTWSRAGGRAKKGQSEERSEDAFGSGTHERRMATRRDPAPESLPTLPYRVCSGAVGCGQGGMVRTVREDDLVQSGQWTGRVTCRARV